MFKYFYNLIRLFCTFSLPLYTIKLTFMLTSIKLITGIEKYNITADNLYNQDEKGFLIGQASSTKCSLPRKALESGRIIGASQDGNREFISLLACISADESFLPLTLIYKGESYDLRDSWIEDLDKGEEAYFAASKNGWSCDALSLQWLKRVFDHHTKKKSDNR